jgi:23S rRNA pseudouridine1911/1915/1917 synthase
LTEKTTSVVLQVVQPRDVGSRLDLFLTRARVSDDESARPSRSMVQKMIADGKIKLNGRPAKPSSRLRYSDCVEVEWSPSRETPLEPEEIPLEVLYEDADCVVINKPPGMVVHPAAGNPRGTLVQALLHHCPDLQRGGGGGRPGIVHRLDKDTSGAIVAAKNENALERLAAQFKERTVMKEYLALVWGKVRPDQGSIDRPIGRHRSERKKMSSLHALPHAREAMTHWRVEERFEVPDREGTLSHLTLLRLLPRTGRTHQLRVHLADQGFPIVGDRVYAPKLLRKRTQLPMGIRIARQALHAERLIFRNPRSGAVVDVRAPLPPDIRGLLDRLRREGELQIEQRG